MTDLHGDEVLDVALRRLPAAGPDPARSERVRTRCHAAIARRYQPGLDEAADRSRRSRDRRGFGRRVLEPVAVAGLSLVYLSAIILNVLRLRTLMACAQLNWRRPGDADRHGVGVVAGWGDPHSTAAGLVNRRQSRLVYPVARVATVAAPTKGKGRDGV